MSSYEVEEFYQEIIKGCDKVTPDNEALIKEVIGLTLTLKRAKMFKDETDSRTSRLNFY